jgi:glycosidase
MVYYGDEAGMWGANDPDCRKPMIWEDIDYEDETYLPDQTIKENSDKVEFNYDLYNHYKKLASIRNSNPALQLGDFKSLFIDDKNGIYIFERNFDNKNVTVALNNGNRNYSAKIETHPKKRFIDKLNDENFVSDNAGKLKFNIEPKWGRIIVESSSN